MCHGAGAADGTSANHKNGTVNTLKSGAPHFNNATSGMYPAAYVTSTSTCANCHNSNANNQAIRQQWAATGHANTTALPWIDYDFKTRVDGCVRCHTTTGFIAYSTAKVTAAWGTASDKTKEVLTCVGCHSDVANGVVRSVTPNNPFADEATFTNADVGTSNICMDCHSGRNNGTSIQAKVTSGADFTNLSYIAPHYLTAGGSLQGKSGYSFPGRTYAALSDNAHSKAGTANSNNTGSDGPCVGCHMSATAKHTFSPVTDASGTITAITTTFCANCHTDSSTFNAGVLDAKKVAFTNALAVLKAALADKGIVVTDNYPYVANKNWGTGQAGANVMGAAFNYKLFAAEPGAYAHNPAYAKQLIADSIEAVATGGSVTGSDVSAYVTSLVGKGVTADQVSSYNTFKNTTSSCASCHSFPPASSSHASATTSPLNCTNCHIYTGMGGATHNNGTVDFGAMTCTSCHPNLSSSHAVHVGNLPSLITAYGGSDTNFMNNNTDSTGYRFGCATCHPSTNANHKNGTIVLNGNGYQQATKVSVTCTAAACHADGKSNYVTSPDWYTGYTGADRCAMCHAATPTTGSHTVHTAINGIHDGSSGITYAATVTCANCHADTVDSAKNINYVNHANGIVSVSFATTNVVSKAQISASSFNAYSTVWTRTGATDTSKLPLSAGNYAGGTCSTIACHNNGTTPAWGTTVKISCVDCHSTL
jgi:predicted CxxxxCH...CXXCH cytochrome family protein